MTLEAYDWWTAFFENVFVVGFFIYTVCIILFVLLAGRR